MSSAGHEWTKHERDGWSVCSRCGMIRNYDREQTTCSGALPKIRQRSEIEDCGQDGVCRLSPGCNRHWEERNRELVRENEVLRSNSDHLSSENASLSGQVESMAMRIESLAEELAKPEDVRLRDVLDALDGRAVIFDGLGARAAYSSSVSEADRLRKLFDDAGQGEHNVLALIDHYQRNSMEADERLRVVRGLLEENGCDCPCDHHPDERGPDCEVCLACRIGEAVGK